MAVESLEWTCGLMAAGRTWARRHLWLYEAVDSKGAPEDGAREVVGSTGNGMENMLQLRPKSIGICLDSVFARRASSQGSETC